MGIINGGRVIEGAVERGSLIRLPGNEYFVDPVNGSDSNRNGLSWQEAFATIQKAVTTMSSYDRALIAPGSYDEQITIARSKSKIELIALGGRGAAFVEPSASNPVALTNEADDVTIIGLGLAGSGTGSALVNRGRRFRARGAKLEGGGSSVKLTLGTAAQIAALTHGKGDDVRFDDCEFAWGSKLVELICTDYGALTQAKFYDCEFHNQGAAAFEESNGSGGAAGVRYRDLLIADCVFGRMEDGSEPTAYVLLNDDNANSGIVTRCSFPSAINSGKSLVSTKLIWTSNFHSGGISTAQPS